MMMRVFQILFVCIPIGLFGWLLWIDLVPSGEMKVFYEVGDQSPYINYFLPSERVESIAYRENGDAFARLIDDPVYFTVNMPKTAFDTVDVRVLFTPNNQSIFEIGTLVDIFSESYDLRPLYNDLIEKSSWSLVELEGVILLDRTNKIHSVLDFLAGKPKRDTIATYHYELEEPYRLSKYTPSADVKTTNVSLRGYHQYLTYIKDETFSLEVNYMDMNRTFGKDDVNIRIYDEKGGVVLEQKREDDGNGLEDQLSSTHAVKISKAGLEEGIYRVELSGTSDIFWKSFKTSQRYMSFIDHLYLADDVGYLDKTRSTDLVTNAKDITFETSHSEGVQTIDVGRETINVNASHEKITHRVSSAHEVYVHIPVNDIQITGSGKYAFSDEAFLNPDTVKFSANTDLDLMGIDTIIAKYSFPKEQNGWLSQSVTFDSRTITQAEGVAHFILSAPDVGGDSSVDIHAIELMFHKTPMTTKQIFRALRDRLPFGL